MAGAETKPRITITHDDFVAAVASGSVQKIDTLLRFTGPTQSSNLYGTLPSSSIAAIAPFRDEPDSKGDTAVHLAVNKGNADMLKYLIHQCKCDANGLPGKKQNQSPLHTAARLGDLNSLSILCDSPGINLGATDNNGWTALHTAVFGKKVQAARLLITRFSGGDGNLVSAKTLAQKESASALHFAAAQGLLGTCRELVNAGADVTATDRVGDTVLHSAMTYRVSWQFKGMILPQQKPQWEIAVVLALSGADVGIKNAAGAIATEYIDKKFPSMGATLKTLFDAKVPRRCATAIDETHAELYKFLVVHAMSNNTAKLVSHFNCNDQVASNIATAIKTLETDRLAKQHEEDDKTRQVDEQSKKKTVLQEAEEKRAAASSSSSEGEAGGGASASASATSHHQGVDMEMIRTLNEEDDPSNGECPFLKKRADRAKARVSGGGGAGGTTEDSSSVTVTTSTSSSVSGFFSNLIFYGIVFAAGFVCCREVTKRGKLPDWLK